MESDNLIIVKDVSATEAGRRFSEMLDAVEHDGESFTIVRHGKPVARLAPVVSPSGYRLKEFLRGASPDEHLAADIAEARALLTADETPWLD
jgi:prevent-host-death family protein